jgi:acetyl esterase/lipase
MVIVVRLVAALCFILSGFTLIRPRSGWGRLALFIPKLFSGSFIFLGGAVGFLTAILAWLSSRDVPAVVMGLAAAAVSSRHIYRIVTGASHVGRDIMRNRSPRAGQASKSMLRQPWDVYWKRPPDCSWDRDVAIGEAAATGNPLLVDLWRPADAARRSGLGIIYLHGSGWHYADKDFGTRYFFRHLASQGHVIADLAYTLAPRAQLLGMMGDAKRAIVWMKMNASDLGINSSRIFLMGGSAGGHLALLAAYTPNHPRLDPPGIVGDTSVRGVISYYGPPDLWDLYEDLMKLPGLAGDTASERRFMRLLQARFGFAVIPVHSLLPSFLGGTPQEFPELYDLASPSKHIGPQCPPTLLLQGMHDFTGVAPAVQSLYEALRDGGCSAFLFPLPDTEHGFDLYMPQWSPAAQAATYVTERFLASLV